MGHFDESSEQWSAYTERFEYFVAANDITEEKVVPTFLSVMGPKTFILLRNLLQPEKPGEKTYDQIVNTLKAHFSPKPLVIAGRFRFHRRNQLEGETLTIFVAVLKKLAEHCEFGDALNDTLQDRLVCGLRCEGIQKRLLTESNLTLQRAIELSVSMELAAKEAQQLSSNSKVYKMETENKGPCFRCGKTGHSPVTCWYKDMECRSCKKKGHIERACRNKTEKGKIQQKITFRRKQKKHVFTVDQENNQVTDTYDDELPLHVLTVAGGTKAYKVTTLLEGQPVKMEIDTGAAVSLVSDVVYSEKLSHLPLKPSDVTLKTYTGESVIMKGLSQVTVELNKQTKKLPLYVVLGDYPSLMGRSCLEQLKVDWQAIHVMTQKTLDLEGVLQKHSEVFKQELGSMEGINVKLTVEPECQPKFLKARPLPYALKPKVEASLNELVKNDVLEPVSVSKWATPIVPVIKKDGGIRICGDFKVTVNPVLSAEQYPLPHINDLFAGLTGGQKFSKIDLN
uniref:CCHC-type domain-containing protein n=1 Tax=Cyprinus carpio TaxID=7962 RepID=A0A8C2AUS2_CYPCA